MCIRDRPHGSFSLVFFEDFLCLFSKIADNTNAIPPNNPMAISRLFMMPGEIGEFIICCLKYEKMYCLKKSMIKCGSFSGLVYENCN